MRWAALLLLTLSPAASWGASVEVKSGEHADFSRLVMQLPKAADWSVVQFEGGYVFRSGSEDIEFNVAQVFDYIPRKRIEKVESGSGGNLQIFVAPETHADAFEIRKGRIVIDIKDGAPDPGSSFDKASEASFSPRTSARNVNGDLDLLHQNPSEILEQGEGFQMVDVIVDALSNENETSARALPSIDEFLTDQARPGAINFQSEADLGSLESKESRSISAIEEALVAQIGRAGSQGLLQADLPDVETVSKELSRYSHEVPQTPPPDITGIRVENDNDGTSHIRIQTTVDRDGASPKQTSNETPDGARCVAESRLAIGTWGTPPEDGLLLANVRASVIGEMDIPDVRGVELLAKYYLFLSFGAEAKVALREFGVYVPDADLLRVIADIMDVGHSPAPSILDGQLDCDGSAGFWAAMAQETFEPDAVYSNDAIAATFSALPIHLRRHLGPIISERFLKSGDVYMAKTIRNSISRLGGEHGDAFDFLSAEMELADGNISPALQSLESLVQENGPLAATALVRAVEARVADGQRIDIRTVDLIDAFSAEHKGSDLDARLIYARILARVYSDDPKSALEILDNDATSKALDEKSVRTLRNRAVLKTTEVLNDVAFLGAALGWTEDIEKEPFDDPVKLAVAKRLSEIGFYQVAAKFMSFEGPLDVRSRMAFAQVQNGLGNEREAVGYLVGLGEPEAVRLRADTLLRLKDSERAAEDYRLIGANSAQNDADFLSENWDALKVSEDTRLSDLARVLSGKEPASSEETSQITLEQASKNLDRSQDVRRVFQAILD